MRMVCVDVCICVWCACVCVCVRVRACASMQGVCARVFVFESVSLSACLTVCMCLM